MWRTMELKLHSYIWREIKLAGMRHMHKKKQVRKCTKYLSDWVHSIPKSLTTEPLLSWESILINFYFIYDILVDKYSWSTGNCRLIWTILCIFLLEVLKDLCMLHITVHNTLDSCIQFCKHLLLLSFASHDCICRFILVWHVLH